MHFVFHTSRKAKDCKIMLEEFDPIFGEPKPESPINSDSGPAPPTLFLMHIFAPDDDHLTFRVTDFHSNTFEVVKSVMQLEDMRDSIGIGDSWSEFVDYIVSAFKSEDIKLVLDTKSSDPAFAKLIAQKSKGMPRISISLTKLVGLAASDAVANMSFELFKALKHTQNLVVQEQERSSQLTGVISAEKEKSESIMNQLGKRHKVETVNRSGKVDTSSLVGNGSQNSPDKQAGRPLATTKVTNRVVPAFRRAKVRGALLQDSGDDKDN